MADFDCIVMGAGVTAARDLRKAGFKVLLVDSSKDIGGRIRTVRDFIQHPDLPNSRLPVEAGAEFVHATLDKSATSDAIRDLISRQSSSKDDTRNFGASSAARDSELGVPQVGEFCRSRA